MTSRSDRRGLCCRPIGLRVGLLGGAEGAPREYPLGIRDSATEARRRRLWDFLVRQWQTVTLTQVQCSLYHATNRTLAPNKILNFSSGKILEWKDVARPFSQSRRNLDSGSWSNPSVLRVQHSGVKAGQRPFRVHRDSSVSRRVCPANRGSVSLSV